MTDLNLIGLPWVIETVDALTDEIIHVSPSAYNEDVRYLPGSVSSKPGPIDYDNTPWLREILDCMDVNSPIREVNMKKGVQIGWTTLLESAMLYGMGHIRTLPIMYMTADKELAASRIENNIIPMLKESDMMHIVRASDASNNRKTGMTKDHIQFSGGGYMVPFGAQNANKMRQFSICFLFKDELDGWPDTVGKDGDPDALSDDRCKAYEQQRKILRGSTPLILATSKIQKRYLQGDQRKPIIHCLKCNAPQTLKWSYKEGPGGFFWETDRNSVVADSVQYRCKECGHAHFEYNKRDLFDPSNGAHWSPTAQPISPDIRSYHLPSMYASQGMGSWASCVFAYLAGWDVDDRRVKDIAKYQKFYNNILGEPFEVLGSKVQFTQVSGHRRPEYSIGVIPNVFAEEYCGSKVLFLTCQVDIHKTFMAVSVMGWTVGMRTFVVEYFRIDGEDCSDEFDPAWGKLREFIEEKKYESVEGIKYSVFMTLIDAGYANATVAGFCAQYQSGVYPIVGNTRATKQRIHEFGEFTTQAGTTGYHINVDHYKDRLAPVLRRDWVKDAGIQKEYHFNAPLDITDKALKELTAEDRREKTDDRGKVVYYWHRPGNKRNELWDLLVYGNAAVEIYAYEVCRKYFELETVDWDKFWQYILENGELVCRIDPESK